VFFWKVLIENNRPIGENSPNLVIMVPSDDQGCQIFLDTICQNVKKYTKRPQNMGHLVPISNGRRIFQMAIKCTSIFHSNALQNVPKLVILVLKFTIWQPCLRLQPRHSDAKAAARCGQVLIDHGSGEKKL
jgi:hypothetical protein